MIEQEAAVEIARARAAEKGWSFGEPISVVHRKPWFGRGGGRFEIFTSFGKLGSKSRFVIDATTGEVLEEGYLPR